MTKRHFIAATKGYVEAILQANMNFAEIMHFFQIRAGG
jgi:phage tail protein X